MKFRIDGRELDEVKHLPLGQVIEAEKALGVSFDDSFGSRMAVMLFVAIKQDNPGKPVGMIADDVMRSDLGTLEEVEEAEEAGPPDEAATAADKPSVNGEGGPEPPETSGIPGSDRLASPSTSQS